MDRVDGVAQVGTEDAEGKGPPFPPRPVAIVEADTRVAGAEVSAEVPPIPPTAGVVVEGAVLVPPSPFADTSEGSAVAGTE